MIHTQALSRISIAAWLLWSALPVRAEDKPSEIRVSYPGVGVGNRPASHSNAVAILHLRGMLEEEFKKTASRSRGASYVAQAPR